MRILYTAPFDHYYLELIRRDCGEVFAGTPEKEKLLDSLEMIHIINDIKPDGVIVEVNKLDSTVLDRVDGLKVISVCRSGTNNVDLESATEKNIQVTNTPSRNAVAVAEWTIALMVNIARNFHRGVEIIKNHNWVDMVKTCYDLEGYELANRTVGIIGVGSVGKQVAKRLACWDMNIFGYDPFVSQESIGTLGIKMTSQDHLLQESDFVILLSAVTPETKGMINRERISLMKPSAFFINTARASLVEEESLLDALIDGAIAGAALDVHHEEPLPVDSPWLKLENVILTPHLGGASKDTIIRHSRMVYEDWLRLADNKKPLNLVNPEVWTKK